MPNTNNIKVAIDARSIGQDHTGDTTYWTGLVRALQNLDSEITYLLFSNTERPSVIPENPRFEWIVLPSRKTRWWSLIRMPLAARRAGADVVHVQYNLSPLVTRGGVTTVHDVSFMREPTWFRPQDQIVLQRFVPPSMRRAAKVVTVSEFSKSEITHFFPDVAGKIAVTPNACSDELQPLSRGTAEEIIKDRLGIEGPFLLTVGTRWPRKNMNLAIEAVGALPDSLPHKLVVTGKPGWGEEETSDRVIATGFVEDHVLSALYCAADLYLAPSHYEGFGITLLEAFRCGCPVLASPAGAHKEVAGNAAAFAPDFEAKSWTKEIEELLGNPGKLQTLREAGLAREKEFQWAKTAALTEAIYREIAR